LESDAVLSVENLESGYGKVKVLHKVSLEVRNGEMVALLGANGSGKTTLLNTLSGFVVPTAGSVTLLDKIITRRPPHEIVRAGVIQVSEKRDLFPEMSTIDNLRLGAVLRDAASAEEDLAQVFAHFPKLQERQNQKVKTMSGGEQQMVAIARALMSRPRVLLLDEPLAGLSPSFVAEIGSILEALKQRGTTMLLVEQNLALAMRVAGRFYILRAGEIVKSGDIGELKENHRQLAHTYYL
jgi:branched-chain amino acid transport system ATP-binding protein